MALLIKECLASNSGGDVSTSIRREAYIALVKVSILDIKLLRVTASCTSAPTYVSDCKERR